MRDADRVGPAVVVRLQLGVALEVRDRLRRVLAVHRHAAERVVRGGVVGVEADRLGERRVGLAAQVQLDADHAEEEVDARVLRDDRPRVAEVAEGALQVLLLVGDAREGEKEGRRRPGRDADAASSASRASGRWPSLA